MKNLLIKNHHFLFETNIGVTTFHSSDKGLSKPEGNLKIS